MKLMIALTSIPLGVIGPIVDRVGFASIAGMAGIKTAVAAGAIEVTNNWGLADTAIVISMIGGLTFIVKNIVEIYITYKKRDDE